MNKILEYKGYILTALVFLLIGGYLGRVLFPKTITKEPVMAQTKSEPTLPAETETKTVT